MPFESSAKQDLIYRLSDLSLGHGTWKRSFARRDEYLEGIAVRFFSPVRNVLKEPTRNRTVDCLTALFRIKDFVENLKNKGFPFTEHVHLLDGEIIYIMDEREVHCYDGGNCGTDTQMVKLIIKIVSEADLANAIQRSRSENAHSYAAFWPKDRLQELWGYCGEQPYFDCEVFGNWKLYLRKPFGLNCSLCLKWFVH